MAALKKDLLVTLRHERYLIWEVMFVDQHSAVPEGYMTIGEIARKMHVTVRTLQHYDREGLLTPSALSDGGRRLYTDRDIVRLHQILSLKHLGFTLADIRDRLIPLDSPSEVADVLLEQEEVLRSEIRRLTEALSDIEALRNEVLSMQQVDFGRYADIILNLQMKNEFYWMIKHFDSDILGKIRSRFDEKSSKDFIERLNRLQNEAVQLLDEGVHPGSDQGIDFARRYWSHVLEFTGGDQMMLPALMELSESEGFDRERTNRQIKADSFIQPALGAYFEREGIDPTGDVL